MIKETTKTIPARGDGRNLFLLTKETYEGQYDAFYFNTNEEAMEYYERLKSETEGHETEDGFMTKEGVFHRVVTIPEAIGLDGKVVWYVSHKCFVPGVYGQFDWINYFTTKEEAKALFDERAELYRQIVKGKSNLTIEEDGEQMLIKKDGKPMVYLDFLAAPIGEIVKVGSFMFP